ncbi:hypothetical protein Btru_053624 [Bulinus truncatus]|nr:hypothetical protein Btru_053624 [Bulinus truncatus]
MNMLSTGNRLLSTWVVFHLTVSSCVFGVCFASPLTYHVTLTTTLGNVTGFRQVNSDVKVETFYAIPYAQKPTGPLRFKPPVPATPWTETLLGTVKPKSCWQLIDTSLNGFEGINMWNPTTVMSEDCLHLNVWRPLPSNDSVPKTIMVWIYGGGFTTGTTTLNVYDGTQLAARNDVIVVSFNYRIGALGFFFMDNEDAPGNVGLLDQVMALQWIKQNAYNLGGSPDNIVIFGESAGAVSVGFHLLSPLSQDLFKYAIMQSAAPVAKWAIQDRDLAKSRSLKLAELLNCTSENATKDMDCLYSASPEAIIQQQWSEKANFNLYIVDVVIGPIVDGKFLPDHPEKMLSRGEVKNTSVLLGVNKNEGYYFDVYLWHSTIFPLSGNGEINETQYDEILEHLFLKNTSTIQSVKLQYPIDMCNSLSSNVDAITGDWLFKCPVISFAQIYSRLGNPVYMYSFEHRTSATPWPEWMGTLHGYEIEILFGLPFSKCTNYTKEEKELSSRMMKLWTDFSKTGKPANETIWPEYIENEEAHYVQLDLHNVEIKNDLRVQQCAFMNSIKCIVNSPSLRPKFQGVGWDAVD